jgi:ABC-type multidrug transport system fused ATPase/permease subunit
VNNRLLTLRQFASELWAGHRLEVMAAIALILCVSLLDGAGLLLLLPLLGAAGLSSDAAMPVFSTLFQSLQPEWRLGAVLLVYLGVIGMSALLNYANNLVNARLQTGFVRGSRIRLHSLLLHAPWEEVRRRRSHEISHQLTSNVDQLEQGVYSVLRGATALVLGLVHLGVASYLAPF